MTSSDSPAEDVKSTEPLTMFAIPRRLDLAVAASLEATALTSSGLRAAVAERVRYLRANGAPPERVVIAIKLATREALTRAISHLRPHLGQIALEDATRAVVGQAVTAAVEAYYA